MSDTKKEFPINEMHGYKCIKSQLVDDDTIAIYGLMDGPDSPEQIGEIIKYSSSTKSYFVPHNSACNSQFILIDIETMWEVIRYMEFIQRFGISVKFEDDSDDRIRESHA